MVRRWKWEHAPAYWRWYYWPYNRWLGGWPRRWYWWGAGNEYPYKYAGYPYYGLRWWSNPTFVGYPPPSAVEVKNDTDYVPTTEIIDTGNPANPPLTIPPPPSRGKPLTPPRDTHDTILYADGEEDYVHPAPLGPSVSRPVRQKPGASTSSANSIHAQQRQQGHNTTPNGKPPGTGGGNAVEFSPSSGHPGISQPGSRVYRPTVSTQYMTNDDLDDEEENLHEDENDGEKQAIDNAVFNNAEKSAGCGGACLPKILDQTPAQMAAWLVPVILLLVIIIIALVNASKFPSITKRSGKGSKK